MATPLTLKTRSFCQDQRGSVAIMFGLSAMVLAMFAGVAIDYSRINNERSRVTAAVDAAALAAGKAMLDGRLSDDEVKDLARTFFDQNVTGTNMGFGTLERLEIELDRASNAVQIEADVKVEMTLTRVAGFDNVVIPVRASTKVDDQDIEIALALDVTGSMAGRKITDLKSAANDLVDRLLENNSASSRVRMALAPYSAAINLGPYAAAASNGRSTDGCVYERTGANAYTDLSPEAGGFFLAGGRPVDIDPTEGRYTYECPSAAVVPLTNDADTLHNAIDRLSTRGGTAGHFGAAWAWYLLSEKWAEFWPASSAPGEKNPKRTKAIVLMTDGIFNMAYANANSSVQAVNLCSKMKGTDVDPSKKPNAHDVIVYAIAYQAPSAAEATLRSCASSSEHYYTAESGTQLADAFADIADKLKGLRLTH